MTGNIHTPTAVIKAFLADCDKKTTEYIVELERHLIALFGKPGKPVVVRCNWLADADGGCDLRLDVSTHDAAGEPLIGNPPFYGVRITAGALEYLTHDYHEPAAPLLTASPDRNRICLYGLLSVLDCGRVVDPKTGEPHAGS